MTNLITCACCGKNYSGKASKCPDCGAISFSCRLCREKIATMDCFFIPIFPGEWEYKYKELGREEAIRQALKYNYGVIHLSCVLPHFSSPKNIKCTDCGHSIPCPNFSLDSFLIPLPTVPCLHKHPLSYTLSNNSGILNIGDCSNCGNPFPLGKWRDCHTCKLPVIPAIHNYENIYSQDAFEGYEYIHSFCTYEAIEWKCKRKGKGGWFSSFFGGPDPGKKKEI
ncbi:MAG: hypothetical protein HOG49_16510 [Candidatus Scalindua sp.]|nr:hypothetical protein [Candidatus Scalindua sp.]